MSDAMPSNKQRMNTLLERVDEVIYGIIAFFLVITAFLTFYSVSQSILDYFKDNDSRHAVIIILDKLMLTLMVLEILYTVRISIRSHSLSAEPILVVGILAAIRRILVISVESGYLITVGQDGFIGLMAEIAVLGLLVLMFVVAIILLRRNKLPQNTKTTDLE
ncbi:MAG: phosphate-starvation-inducible PsiE family protein [bacterium]